MKAQCIVHFAWRGSVVRQLRIFTSRVIAASQ